MSPELGSKKRGYFAINNSIQWYYLLLWSFDYCNFALGFVGDLS